MSRARECRGEIRRLTGGSISMILKWMFPGGKSLPHVVVSHNARFDPVSGERQGDVGPATDASTALSPAHGCRPATASIPESAPDWLWRCCPQSLPKQLESEYCVGRDRQPLPFPGPHPRSADGPTVSPRNVRPSNGRSISARRSPTSSPRTRVRRCVVVSRG